MTGEHMGNGKFSTLPLAISQLNVSYHSVHGEQEHHTPHAHIGSWALETVVEEPTSDTTLTLSHCTLENTGSSRQLCHPVPFSLASESTAVDYWSNAPIHTDAWHLIQSTQIPHSRGRRDGEGELSDMGATGSASPGAQ